MIKKEVVETQEAETKNEKFKTSSKFIEEEAKEAKKELSRILDSVENDDFVKEKENNLNVVFYNEKEEESAAPEEHKKVIEKITKIIDEENEYYSQFFDGKNVVDTIEIKESEDNFFAPDIEKRIDVPFKNPETTKETFPILRHEVFHRAMIMGDENWREPRDEIYDNIKKGEDTNEIEFIGNIKTAQFQKFVESEKGKGSVLLAAEIGLKKRPSSGTHLERNMEEIIEESLADEAMFKREKEINSENAIDRVVKAKITALDNIAKNKGLKNYKELDPL